MKSVGQSSLLSLSDDKISSMSLPRSLFEALQKKSSDKHVGLVFTSYLDNILFPLTVSDSNSSVIVGSSVIGATVVSSQPVQNLSEPIVMVFKVENLTV